MQTASPAIDASHGLVYPLESILDRIEPAKLFARLQPLEIELGSGDGSFLVQYAAAHPERNFIGIERLLGRLRKIDKKGRQAGLSNLRVVRIESAYFLNYLLPAHSAAALHVYFPDPWPKRKHRRHRLINEQFVALAHQALEPVGAVYLRTDDADYFEQMVRVFSASDLFRKTETPADLAAMRTDFELEFNQRGVPTLRAAYSVVPNSPAKIDQSSS
ncbi:MAG TPA: tRNA (guanosine(46)-N7)-methyltransferase TrmB [Verrucomicrobiae bacterium]|nr:tRNA (guanosine(46)-N7)-methyltransferase TrmB [Verrucomicrobiae bacterium]